MIDKDSGRPGGLSSQATEPVPVSALRASIPDAQDVQDTIWCALDESMGPDWTTTLGARWAYEALRDGGMLAGPLPVSAWRTDSPPFGKRPIWQFVWLQGENYHSGTTWFRQGWGTAAIRVNDADDGLLGYRRSDIERICRDNDIQIESVDVVGWLPMTPPAFLAEVERPALQPCDDGEWSAQAIEARRAETHSGSVEDESAVGNADAPNPRSREEGN